MQPEFEHFVITRFNIPAKGWAADKNNQPVNDDSWIRSRIALFEQFCFPSLNNQSTKNFKWLVFFDPDSPEILKNKITEWSSRCDIFFPHYASDYDEFIETGLAAAIQSLTSSTNKYILTTRIDNDDAFHEKAIETIQNQFTPSHNYIIELRTGICLDIVNQIALRRNYISNPFLTYVEKNSPKLPLRTVMAEGHPRWIEIVPFEVVEGQPMWIQVIHEKNVSNALKGKFSMSAFHFNPFHIQMDFRISKLFTNSVKYMLILFSNNTKHAMKLILRKVWKVFPTTFRNQAHSVSGKLRELPYQSKIDRNKVKYLIKKHLRKKAIVLVDIGANKGDFYSKAKEYLNIKKAYLIEPLPHLKDTLITKFANNKCEIIPELLSKTVGEKIEFNINEFDETSSILNIDENSIHLDKIPTKTINRLELMSNTLDNICKDKNIDHIDLLKIDVQGAEGLVLEGGENILDHTEYIWIEVSFKSLYENSILFDEVVSRLNSHNFIMIELSPGFRNKHREIVQADVLFKKLN